MLKPRLGAYFFNQLYVALLVWSSLFELRFWASHFEASHWLIFYIVCSPSSSQVKMICCQLKNIFNRGYEKDKENLSTNWEVVVSSFKNLLFSSCTSTYCLAYVIDFCWWTSIETEYLFDSCADLRFVFKRGIVALIVSQSSIRCLKTNKFCR